MKGILDGIRVVDLARFVAGPYCAMLLGDMGAEVIKVEKPGGDEQRHMDPKVDDLSTYYIVGNRNKKSLTLNFKSEEGKKILTKLFETTDVVVENFRPGVMERLGFGYEDLKKINPRIILTSVSGFGQDGPLAQKPAFDSIAQAMGGLMATTGTGGPTLAGTWVGDYSAGLYAAFGTMLALYARQTTGVGQHIDVALLDSVASWSRTAIPDFLMFGKKPTRNGGRDVYHCPIGPFETKDGYVYITAATDAQYAGVCRAAGHPEWLQDDRMNKEAVRLKNKDLVNSSLEAWTKTVTTQEALQKISAEDCPCAPINDIEGVLNNEQTKYREMYSWVETDKGFKVAVPGIVVKLSDTPGYIRCAPPSVGNYNDEFYTGLGYTPEQIREMYEKKII
ncbi:MAG: CoA transferase [Lachnospiraceae bacterium]|nr:CoA transferase [Lachnospiraceae bacterium]